MASIRDVWPGRYEFKTYLVDDIGPKQFALAVPIYEGGRFIDLLLIDCVDLFIQLVTGRGVWLGRDNITGNVRLHAHPMDWLEDGRFGCCHVAPISRQGLKSLDEAESIMCNNIATVLDAWEWGFGSNDAELSRFEIDDTPDSIRQYFEFHARWCAVGSLSSAGVLH